LNSDWQVRAELQTSLAIVRQDVLQGTRPTHPALKRISLEPTLTAEGQPTGILEIVADIGIDDGEAAFDVARDVARDVVNTLVDFAAVLTAAPAKVVKGPTVIADDPDDSTKHTAVVPGTMRNLYPPVPLLAARLFQQTIRPELRRVMAWYRRGISEELDVVASLASLFTSLDLLSNEFECTTERTRECPACKKVFDRKPGTTDKNRNLLKHVAGLETDIVRAVLKAREKVVHGGIDLTSQDIRDLEVIRVHLSVALIRGLKRALHLDEGEPPPEGYLGLPLADPILTLEYRDAPAAGGEVGPTRAST
jgi:hypothetical protein